MTIKWYLNFKNKTIDVEIAIIEVEIAPFEHQLTNYSSQMTHLALNDKWFSFVWLQCIDLTFNRSMMTMVWATKKKCCVFSVTNKFSSTCDSQISFAPPFVLRVFLSEITARLRFYLRYHRDDSVIVLTGLTLALFVYVEQSKSLFRLKVDGQFLT